MGGHVPGAAIWWTVFLVLRSAARRALLVPLRLGVVIVALIAVLVVHGWSLRETRAVLDEQARRARLLGQTGWRVTLPLAEGGPVVRRHWIDTGLLPIADDATPLLALLGGPRALRAPEAAAALYHPVMLASPGSGLRSRDSAGETPCVWLGPPSPPGAEWIVEERLRCTVQAVPPGWAALNAEFDQATLVLPLQAAGLAAGSSWPQAVVALFVAGPSPCQRTLALNCERLAVTRAVGVTAGAEMSRWTRWSMPAVLVAALLAVTVYLSGLRGALLQEFALRMALGRSFGPALRWLVTAQLVHVGGLLACVGFAAAGLTQTMGVVPARWELLWGLGWLAACVATASCMALAWGWRARHQGLQQLGRVG